MTMHPLPAQLPTLPLPPRAPDGQLGWMAPAGAFATAGVPLLPFALPSLDHLDEDVALVLAHARDVEGLQSTTLKWWGEAYRVLRQFLLTEGSDRAFLSGDIQQQLGVLDAWVGSLRSRRLARSTINAHWRGVRAILRRVQARRGVVNPLDYHPVPKVGRVNPRCLPRESAERLLRFVQNYQWKTEFDRVRNLAIVATMLLAGLRRGEVLRLAVSDVDPVAKTVRILRGKGRHGGKDRTAYMPDQLGRILGDYLRARGSRECSTPALFVRTREDQPIGEGTIGRLFKTIRKIGGFACSPHALRHTYATLLRQAGVPDRVAMELLGHTSLEMLQRYSHVFDGEQVTEAAKLALDLDLHV